MKKKMIIIQKSFYAFVLRWLRYLFRIETKNRDKILDWLEKEKKNDPDRPLIVVANHISAWDPFLILSAMRRKFFMSHVSWRLPAYYKHFNYRHKRWLFDLLGVYKIYPVHKAGSMEASLKGTMKMLQRGYNTVFFPQGKRIRAGEEPKAKNGIAHLLKNTNAYILPVYIDYAKKKKDGFEVKIGKTKIVFGDVIKSEHFLENYSDEERPEAVMSQVWKLKEEFADFLEENKLKKLRKKLNL